MACSTCNTPNCGCTGTYTVSATCPPACSEVFNMQCIVYTGVDLTCDGDTVISRNDYLDSAITKLVNYVCSKVAPPASVVAGSAFIDVVPTTDPVTSVTTYTVSADMAAFEIWVAPIITNQILAKVLAGPGIDVAADPIGGTVTVSHEDTSSVTNLSSNNTGNSFIQSINFTFDTFGHVTGAAAVPGTVVGTNNYGQFDITDTDPGTYIWSSVGSALAVNPSDTFTVLSGEAIDVDVDTTALAMRIAFTGVAIGSGLSGNGTIADPLENTAPNVDQMVWTRFTAEDGSSVDADTITDNLTVTGSGGGISTTIDPTTDTLKIENLSPASSVELVSAGGTETLVNDGTGPLLANKGLSAGAGVTLSSDAVSVTIENTANKWARFEANSGNTTADDVADIFSILGGTGIETEIVGDELTIANTGVTEVVTATGSGLSGGGAGVVTLVADVLRDYQSSVGYTSGAAAQTITHGIGEKYVSVKAFNGNTDVTATTEIVMVNTTEFTIESSTTDVTDLVILG